MQGDNPPKSRDSREYGPVPYNMITGLVLFKYVCRVNLEGSFSLCAMIPQNAYMLSVIRYVYYNRISLLRPWKTGFVSNLIPDSLKNVLLSKNVYMNSFAASSSATGK